jgi:hypothetical protein
LPASAFGKTPILQHARWRRKAQSMVHQVIRPAGAAAVALALAALWVVPASAAEGAKKPTAACSAATSASKAAADDERAGKLRDARKEWQACIDDACGNVSQSCLTRLSSLESWMPSVVPVVTDAAGLPKVDVEVKMDGEVLTTQLDGHGLPVEPGLHEFTFSADGKTLGTEKVLVADGQRNRLIAISLRDEAAERRRPAPPAESNTGEAPSERAAPESGESSGTTTGSRVDLDTPPEPSRSHGPSAWAWVSGAVGIAGLASGAMLTYWGRHDNDQLSRCSPRCPTSSVDHIRTLYIASDITAGVGAASALVSIWLFASSMGSSGETRHHDSAYTVDVRPTPAGGFASVSGQF